MSILADKNAQPVEVKFGAHPDDSSQINTVWIKRKYSLGETISIQEASFRVQMTADGETGVKIPISDAGQMLAHLKVAVTNWDGPMFEGVRLSPGVWEKLDAQMCMWWMQLVYQEVLKLNKPVTSLPAEVSAPDFTEEGPRTTGYQSGQ